MRTLMSWIVFYWRALWNGELRFCDGCNRFTQCLPGGDLRSHWDYCAEQLGRAGVYVEAGSLYTNVPDYYKAMRVCINCSGWYEDKLHLHSKCCRRLMDQWRQDNLEHV